MRLVGLAITLGALLALSLSPVSSLGSDHPDTFTRFLRANGKLVSQPVLISWYTSHPQEAPPKFRQSIEALRTASTSLSRQTVEISQVEDPSPELAFGQKRFNKETGQTGLPQNEESVVFCPANEDEILMATNDFRGLLESPGNLTGWHYSKNGGASVFKEGLQAEIRLRNSANALEIIPSGGDPVARAVATGVDTCDFYAAGLAFDPGDGDPNAIVVYRTSDEILNGTCRDSSCWPDKRAVATATIDPSGETGRFLDKEWMDVGVSGDETVVWVTYTEFDLANESSPIRAVQCDSTLISCTPPIAISGAGVIAQFSYVTIAPDGKVYVSWIELSEESDQEVFTIKMRVAPAGSTSFGPEETVAVETNPLGFGSFLSANDFRIASIPENTVLPLDDGVNRFYVVWPYCVQPAVPLGGGAVQVCRNSDVKVAFSDDDGASFTTTTINQPGQQYFPSIDADTVAGHIYIAYFSSQGDPWNHRYQTVVAHSSPDMESFSFVSLTDLNLLGDVDCDRDRDSIDALRILQDVAGVQPILGECSGGLNEPGADPLLGGLFIGDYIEVFAHNNLVVVGYNANYTELGFLGTQPAVHQQDNYLGKFRLP